MRPALKRLQQIEHQLLGRPTVAEATDWQVQLLTDPELTTDAKTQHLLYQGIQLAGRQQLRRELNQIHARLEATARRRRWFLGAVQSLRRVLPRLLRR